MALAQPARNHKNMAFVGESMLHLHDSKPTLTTTTMTDIKAETKKWHGNVNGNNSLRGTEISGEASLLCKQGRLQEAFGILHQMDHRGIYPNSSTYASLLHCCVNNKALSEGELVHSHIIRTGFQCQDIFLENTLVNMYAKCGSIVNARRVLEQMPERNVVSWTAMIAAYARLGCGEEAVALFARMQRTGIQPNQFTLVSVLPACANLASVEYGKEVHEDVIRTGYQANVYVGSALVDMYVKCGRIEDAHQVFDRMPERNVVSWNTMIAGYAQNGHVDKAYELFEKMFERDVVSWTTIITGYAQNGCVDKAMKLFDTMPERDLVSWNAMIAGYAKNGRMDEALKLFQRMPERNVVSWTAMIAGYAQNGCLDDALKLFQKLPEPDAVSWNTMIAGYAQNGHVDKAMKLLHEMPKPDVVSWNAMIAGCSQHGCFEEALKLFQHMQLTSVKPDLDTFASVLPAYASLAALGHGKEVHENITRSGFHSDVFVGNALVDMYAKCGSIEDARKVFDKMPTQNVVSWNAMIIGYAMHGWGVEALRLFEDMQHYGRNPDHVTFIGVLSACCHSGLVDDGWKYFQHMKGYYHITPEVEHYGCMVDLLGRAGRLEEAHDFVNKMPIKADVAIWKSLLAACRIHANIELGEHAAECLLELDPKIPAPYVLLSNIYAAAGRWDDIERVRKMMKDRRVKKNPGCSWIEVNKKVYAFLIGDITPGNAENLCRIGDAV
eukprot:Gb_41545 [translate_table: standard]